MALKASKELHAHLNSCTERTLPAKQQHLIALAAHLAKCDQDGARDRYERAAKAGASPEELYCAACAASCTAGDRVLRGFEVGKRVERQALDKQTYHLVSLAACLASGCPCASGHIVEARKAGVKDQELARAACLAACAAGESSQWRYAEALQCAERQSACAC